MKSTEYKKAIRKENIWRKKHPILAWFKGLRYLPYKVKRICFDEPKMATKHGFQRMFRGYDDIAYWGLYDHVTEVCIPVLKFYKSRDAAGYPAGFKNKGEWNKILEKMIKSFELIKKDEFGFSQKEWKKKDKIIKEGLHLFAEHFQNLWD